VTVTVDTSVVVPALASWHESHDVARTACRSVRRLPAHVLVEAISVLTRLPGGMALDIGSAVTAVRGKFPDEPLVLGAAEHVALCATMVAAGLRGGQAYDALVAATVVQHDGRLLSLDTRAVPVYRATGVAYELLR
jgi:predicted nucleic acid-binding protein